LNLASRRCGQTVKAAAFAARPRLLFRQCPTALAGNGGVCSVAPMQTEEVRVHTRRGSYRVIRDAID
jgi:hypothetical protein